MSGAMMDALKKKRMGEMGGQGMLAPAADHGEPKADLHALVAALSGSQKQELMGLLSGGGRGSDVSEISKGAPSDQERSKIADKMNSEDDDGPMQAPDDETDEIGMSMLSSADKDQAGVERPARSLGDRVRMNMASKLKAKGKL